MQKGSKDPIPEELDFQGLEEEEEENSPIQERKDSGGERGEVGCSRGVCGGVKERGVEGCSRGVGREGRCVDDDET